MKQTRNTFLLLAIILGIFNQSCQNEENGPINTSDTFVEISGMYKVNSSKYSWPSETNTGENVGIEFQNSINENETAYEDYFEFLDNGIGNFYRFEQNISSSCDFIVSEQVQCGEDEGVNDFNMLITILGNEGDEFEIEDLLHPEEANSSLIAGNAGVGLIMIGPFESNGLNGYAYSITKMVEGNPCSHIIQQIPVECIKTPIELIDPDDPEMEDPDQAEDQPEEEVYALTVGTKSFEHSIEPTSLKIELTENAIYLAGDYLSEQNRLE